MSAHQSHSRTYFPPFLSYSATNTSQQKLYPYNSWWFKNTNEHLTGSYQLSDHLRTAGTTQSSLRRQRRTAKHTETCLWSPYAFCLQLLLTVYVLSVKSHNWYRNIKRSQNFWTSFSFSFNQTDSVLTQCDAESCDLHVVLLLTDWTSHWSIGSRWELASSCVALFCSWCNTKFGLRTENLCLRDRAAVMVEITSVVKLNFSGWSQRTKTYTKLK